MRLRSLPLLTSLMILAGAGAARSQEPAALLKAIQESRLDAGRAVTLKKVKLNAGLGLLNLEDGILVPAMPATTDGVSPTELVFLGKGRIEMDAPDKIEAGQLELFTGAPRLDESFTEAVLVVGSDAAVTALLRKPAAQLDEATRQRADALWGEWRKKREREIFDVDGGILLDALKDPLSAGYFGAWFRGGSRGDFLYFVEPDEQEQVKLGRFVPIDATDKEKRKIEKEIQKAQRKGRLVGLEVGDLGQWDTWVSASLRGSSGQAVPGTPAFEPKKYTLEARLTQPGLRLSGKARIDLVPVVAGSRAVELTLPEDFQVERVTDAGGQALFFHRNDSGLTVILPQAVAAGETPAVVVEYSGRPIEKDFNLTTLAYTEHWFPHAGLADRATYEATFRWPKGFGLVASGRRLDGGDEADGTHWERRSLEVPSQGFSFEVGHFDVETARAGHIQVTFAFGSGSTTLTGRSSRDDVKKAVTESLAYYEEIFGPYPLDELTVSTANRSFSQGLLSFVTISDLYLGNFGVWSWYFGLEDRRLVIAHEIAHQWWGNMVGWASDRDQWISEAMASYSAYLYGKNRLKDGLSGRDLTSGWQEELTSSLENGRSIESLGPVALGGRLDSSLSGDAYRVIVYKKGAVVLDMLSRLLGEENFPKVLRQVIKVSTGKSISTADLFSMIEQVTSTELDDFAQQFVYGTGLPEVFYSYRFEKNGQGWVAKGQARQTTPYNVRYKVVRTGRGTWDVPEEAVQQIDVRTSALVVPVEIEIYNPKEPKGKGKDGANEIVRGHILLKGESTDFAIDVEHEPKAFWLDRRARVFGLFYDESRNPKQALYSQAAKASEAGRKEEAEKLYAQALAAPEPAPESESGATVYWQDIQWARRILNARIESSRAFLLMDLDRDDEADAAIGRARRVVRDDLRLDRMQARLEVRRGRYEKAYQLLRRGDRHDVLDAQDYALLAVAARETGHAKEYEEALKKARENGVDVSALTAAPSAPSGP